MKLWQIHKTTVTSQNANLLIEGLTALSLLTGSGTLPKVSLWACRYVGSKVPLASDHLVKMLYKMKAEQDADCCARWEQQQL